MHPWLFVALMLKVIGMDGWFENYAGSAGGTPTVVQDDGGSVWAMDGNEPPPRPRP